MLLLRADNKGEGGVFALAGQLGQSVARSSLWSLALGSGRCLAFLLTPIIAGHLGVVGRGGGFEAGLARIRLGRRAAGADCFDRAVRGPITWHREGGDVLRPADGYLVLALAAGGLLHIADSPVVLLALNPWYGVVFLFSHGILGLTVLGLVFLAVTGAEALYADLGHFGRKPIQAAWLGFVLPALMLNAILVQGALVLRDPGAIENPSIGSIPVGRSCRW